MFQFKKLKSLILLIIVVTQLVTSVGHAQNCVLEINQLLKSMDAELVAQKKLIDFTDHRTVIAKYAVKKGIPVFYKNNSLGEKVPVILLNRHTIKKLRKYIENSFGTQVALQKDWNNDHGLLRKSDTVIDLDTPGARGFGEVNETGLSWKNIYSYLELKSPDDYPVLEVSYLLTKEEKEDMEYYHRVRRAAIYRVQFTFDGHESPVYPETLKGGGEHCFTFCKAESVGEHEFEIIARLKGMGLKNPNEYLQNPEIEKALLKVRKYINSADQDNLNNLMTATPELRKLFSGQFPSTVKKEKQRLQFINWIVSLDSKRRYAKLMKDLGITGNYGIEDAMNKRSSVIFVYDENANVNDFKNGLYKGEGKFVEWPKTKQFPVQ